MFSLSVLKHKNHTKNGECQLFFNIGFPAKIGDYFNKFSGSIYKWTLLKIKNTLDLISGFNYNIITLILLIIIVR